MRAPELAGYRTVLLGASKDPNPKLTLLLIAPGCHSPAFAIKAAASSGAAAAIEREKSILRRVREMPLGDVDRTIPSVVDAIRLHRPVLVTSGLPGTPMTTRYHHWRHTARAADVAEDFAAAESWLRLFQAATGVGRGCLDLCSQALARLPERYGGRCDLRQALDRLTELHRRLSACATPRTAVHGDFWAGNILVEQGRVSGVVDWELAAASGEPMRDVVRFALTYALYLDRHATRGRFVSGHSGLRASKWGAGIEYALYGGGWLPQLVRQFLEENLRRLGASPTLWREAALAGLAEIAATADHDGFARSHLELFQSLVEREEQR